MQIKVNESDWKLFRSRMADWQEAYMDRLNQEYIALLSSPGDASDKFWELEKRINRDNYCCMVDTIDLYDYMVWNTTKLSIQRLSEQIEITMLAVSR